MIAARSCVAGSVQSTSLLLQCRGPIMPKANLMTLKFVVHVIVALRPGSFCLRFSSHSEHGLQAKCSPCRLGAGAPAGALEPL